MNILLGAFIGVAAGLSWNFATHSQPMTYWQMVGLVFGSMAVAEVTMRLLEARRVRRRRVHRAAVVRSWNGVGRRKTPTQNPRKDSTPA